MRKAVSPKTAFATLNRKPISIPGSEIHYKEMKVTNLNCNLSVAPANRNVKRENARAVQTIKKAPRECSKCRYALFPNTGLCTNFECPRYERAGAMTSDQLLKDYEPPALFHGRHWGSWTLDVERLCLVHDAEPVTRGEGRHDEYVAFLGDYEIDVEVIRQSSQVLDWIFQIRGKCWASSRVMRDLLEAFHSIFYPQQNLCSGGGDKVIQNPKAFLKRRIATVGRPDGPQQAAA